MNTAAAEEGVADKLVAARSEGRSLSGFPGAHPTSMAEAYRIQELAISKWQDSLVGWKIGYIAADRRPAGDPDRLVGPIWRGQCRQGDTEGSAVDVSIFASGFAAVEAELVIRLGQDLPTRGRAPWTAEEVAGLDQQLLLGIEVASSPIPDINALGPSVIAADFGNNNGLVLGAALTTPSEGPPPHIACFIDGRLTGTGSADNLPGGIHHGLATALNILDSRGQQVRAGMLFATGAITGIHPIGVGQHCRVAAVDGPSVELRTGDAKQVGR